LISASRRWPIMSKPAPPPWCECRSKRDLRHASHKSL
jgi:hypothetical protein